PHIIAARHDRSAELRHVPIGAPPAVDRTEREPLWRRISRHTSGLLPDSVLQDTPSVTPIPGPARSVGGVGNVNNVVPPDTTGAVGPNHFVQWVNLSFAVYWKGDATAPPALLYGPAPGNTVWRGFGGPCETTNNGDPI